MKNNFKYLALLLFGMTFAFAQSGADKGSKEKSFLDGPWEAQLFFFIVALLIFFPLIWLRTRFTASPSNASLSPANIKAISDSLAPVVTSEIKLLAQSIKGSEASIKTVLSDMGPQLVTSMAKAAAVELNKTALGEVNMECMDLKKRLEAANQDLVSVREKVATALGECDAAFVQKRQSETNEDAAIKSKVTLQENLTFQTTECASLKLALTNREAELEKEKGETSCANAEIKRLRIEANKGYEVLAPAKIKSGELGTQMQALYQESLAGSLASTVAWTTLTTFASAQADASAKDFQLQIVRRVGLTLVNYWKQQGLPEKDRHDKLVQWAKVLNEYADGRYNLLVPSVGEPIDRSRMSCATSVTAIREVLCWQVRNPAGANFSLAEVA